MTFDTGLVKRSWSFNQLKEQICLISANIMLYEINTDSVTGLYIII